jgi:transcriptional regulator with XRE-family HTH domain
VSGASFADRLNMLFDVVRPSGREAPYSNKEVAALVRDRGGAISDVYIWQLRTGRRTNPTKDHIESLAAFFGVGAAYFFDDEAAARTTDDLRLLDTLRRMRTEQVSLRTVLTDRGLSPASQEIIHQLVERCAELEGLNDRDDDG